jgi:predicted MFS family arabinose efflux permease
MSGVRNPAVAALVVAELISTLGSRMTYLALPWFVLVTTGSAAKMSVVLAVQILPMAILGIPSGSLVQRFGSRTAMLACDFARAPLIMSLPLLHSAGMLSFGLLLAIVAAIGAFMPPYAASQRVILPELVGEDVTLMSQANSLIEGGTAAAALIGPALAGILIPFLGAPNVLYIDAATYLVAFALVLIFVPRPKPLAQEQPSGGLLDGVRYVARDAFMGSLVLIIVFFGFFSSALSVALPAHAYLAFESPRVAGLFYSALGAGALLGTVIAVMLIPRTQPLRLAAAAIIGVTVPLWLLGMDLPAWAFTFALFSATLFTPLVNGPVMGVLTARMTPEIRPKAMTAIIALNTVAAPLGFLLAGQVIDDVGTSAVFYSVAAGFTAASLLFVAVVHRHLRTPAAVLET